MWHYVVNYTRSACGAHHWPWDCTHPRLWGIWARIERRPVHQGWVMGFGVLWCVVVCCCAAQFGFHCAVFFILCGENKSNYMRYFFVQNDSCLCYFVIFSTPQISLALIRWVKCGPDLLSSQTSHTPRHRWVLCGCLFFLWLRVVSIRDWNNQVINKFSLVESDRFRSRVCFKALLFCNF